MKKQFIIAFLSLNFLYAVDLLYTLPNTPINLKAGEQRTDTAFSLPSRQNWEMTTFNFNSSSNLILNGAAGSKYTLKVDDKTTTFYANSFTIGTNSNLELNSFHTISFANGVNLGENANFTIINAGKSIDPSGSEWGGYSKIRFTRNSNFVLGANSTANFSMATIFSSNGEVILNTNSTLDISVTNAVRFENKFVNNGGTAIFRNDYKNVLGKNNVVYNIGQSLNVSTPTEYKTQNTISNFINNGGTITIYGDFQNGGQAVTDAPFDPPFGGGGNLILNGGVMEVKGTLISQRGGDLMGNQLRDPQNSTIQIYGGTLIVGGGLQNKEGSTLIFGMLNGQMGMLKGSLTNTGQVVIDANGMVNVGNYTIIEGQITGLDSDNIAFINRSDFFDVSYKDGSVSVTEASSGGGGSGGGVKPPTKMEVFKSSLYGNETSIFNALSSKLGGDMEFFKHFDTEKTAKEALTTTEQLIKESYVAQPQTMINALQSNALPLPVPKRVAVSRRTAASEIIRFDNGKRVSPFAKKVVRAPKNRNFYFNPLGAILRADKLTGYIAGFTLGTNYEARNYASQIYFAYAYGESSQDFDTQSTDTTGNLFQAGFLNRYSYSVFELETNANLLAGIFKLKNEWANTAVLNSTASFGDYQLNLGLIAGAKLGKRLSFKPFAGIQNYFEFREGFKQDGGLQIESKGYNAYIIDGVLGVEGRYIFNELVSIYGKFSFEERLYNTHKEMLMWAFDNELRYDNKSYDNALSLSVGTQILTWYDFNLDAELLYKHYNNGLNYFGGSFMLKYAF